ncbi:hypothetical protein ACFE04_030219 [Oxalis oulophora]
MLYMDEHGSLWKFQCEYKKNGQLAFTRGWIQFAKDRRLNAGDTITMVLMHKVVTIFMCTRSRSHDWTDCPFAHPGEKARRRDPRRYCYTGTICSDFRRNGACSRGEECEFAHGVFECWLHPSRYRTEACKDGKNCKRKVCFFAHTPHQLRILPEVIITENEKHKHMTSSTNQNHCCVYCHNHLTNSVSNSPTSTLFGLSHLSPPLSPPLSPVSHRSSPVSHRISKFSNVNSSNFSPNYKDSLTELMTSLEAMNVNHEVSSPISPSFNWVDVNFNNDDQQFVLSPSTPARVHQARNLFNNGDYHQYKSSKGIFGNIDQKVNYGTNGLLAGSSSPDPDLGWVNDLLK